jgi:predicted PurR-regulated permease PerM
MPIFFAVLTVILNFIPNFGPMVATILPLPVIFLDPQVRIRSATLCDVTLFRVAPCT